MRIKYQYGNFSTDKNCYVAFDYSALMLRRVLYNKMKRRYSLMSLVSNYLAKPICDRVLS